MNDMTKADAKPRPMSSRRANIVERLRISIICGGLFRYDAISECALACLDAAIGPGESGTIEVRIYCLESDVNDSRVYVVESARALIADPFYQASAIIIHHFGIFSELHNTLAVAPRTSYVIVQFYGVTPPQFMPRSSEGLIGKSFIQIGLFENADEIVVNSAYLEDELRRIGVDKPMRRIDLFGVNIGCTADRNLRRAPKPKLDIVYCGRFVESKQILPLLQALDALSPDLPSLRLTLVGVVNHSDAGYFEQIQRQAFISRFEVIFELNRTPEQVIATIGVADLLVLPSLHEGFGMPVAEALAALTPVVCSDAGSLPEVAGGMALLFKSTDTDALTAALRDALNARAAGEVMSERGRFPYAVWADQAQDFSKKYQRNFFIGRWRSTFANVWALIPSHKFSRTMREDAVRSIFQHWEENNPGESQLLGRIVALKTIGRMRAGDVNGAVDVLHRWAFGRPIEDQHVFYWRNEIDHHGIGAVVARLSSGHEVRSSSLRRRSLSGLRATLLEYPEVEKASANDPDGMPLLNVSGNEATQAFEAAQVLADLGLKSAPTEPDEDATASAQRRDYNELIGPDATGIDSQRYEPAGWAARFFAAVRKSAIIHRADALRDAGEFAKAAAAYEKAYRLFPDRIDLCVQMGNMLKDSGFFSEAEFAYRTAIAKMPHNPDTFLQYGHLCRLTGRMPLAVSLYRHSAALDNEQGPAREALQNLELHFTGSRHQ